METNKPPERHHRHDHAHEEEEEEAQESVLPDATMDHGPVSLHRGATLFGHRHDEMAGGRRGEIREVDFFSKDSGARHLGDGAGRGVPGGGRDDVNVSSGRLDLNLQLISVLIGLF